MLMGCRHASRLCLATRTHHAALALFVVVTVTHALAPARNHHRHHTRARAHMCSVGISVVTVAWAHAPCRNFCGHHASTRTRSRGASTARLFVTLTYLSTCHHHTANRNCLGKQHCAAITWWRRHRLRRRATAADRERWALHRAHGWQRPVGTGGVTASSAANLRVLQALLLRCRCGALVQYSAALRQAKRQGRQDLHQGDGCATQCGKHNQNPARRVATPARWETELGGAATN